MRKSFPSIRPIAFAGLLFACAALGAFAVLWAVFPLPSLKPYSTVVRDARGEMLHTFLASDGKWRIRTDPEKIPPSLRSILLEKEDRYFTLHPGVNPISVVRALAQNLKSGTTVSGASTITMQVARMLEPKERTVTSKIVEMFRALQLELSYSKDEILELYLSLVPLGGNIEGLASASLLYYQCPIERLDIAHLIDLILIPNDPNTLRPDRNGEALYGRRLAFAARWHSKGLLTDEEMAIVRETPGGVVRHEAPRLAPHASIRLKAEHPSEDRLETTIDLRLQRTVEKLLSAHLRPWKARGVHNGAVVVIENRTRNVLAYVGSEDFADGASDGQVDAARAIRSPGSTLKPFLYAMQMESGTLTPKSVLLDTPYDAEGFYAENYDGTYSGFVYADDALRRSLNVPMIRLLQDAGVPAFSAFLRGLGFTSLEAQDPGLGLSMIVGGCGVTLEELAGAFATFPAGGVYVRPRLLRHGLVEDAEGHRVFSASTAFMVCEILSGLDRPDLPNNFESSLNLPKVAYKTGTSYGRRDAWSVGCSAEYTVGVWVGNADNSGNPDLVGSKGAAPLLVDILNSISTPHLKAILPMPEDLRTREVCARSGCLPTPLCDHRLTDFYSVTRTQSRTCAVDREMLVSASGDRYYCMSCLSSHPYRTIVVHDYPPELLDFWSRTGRALEKTPPHNPDCPRSFAGGGPTIVSPAQDMTYYMASSQQKLALRATSALDVSDHFWYVDDAFRGKRSPGKTLFLSIPEGEHLVTCVDNKGRLSSVRIRVHQLFENNASM
jgi:penicillin-binding protein 1C